jgi:hypothetical protein
MVVFVILCLSISTRGIQGLPMTTTTFIVPSTSIITQYQRITNPYITYTLPRSGDAKAPMTIPLS